MNRKQLIEIIHHQSRLSGLPVGSIFSIARLDRSLAQRWAKEPEKISEESLKKMEDGLSHIIACMSDMLEAVQEVRQNREAA